VGQRVRHLLLIAAWAFASQAQNFTGFHLIPVASNQILNAGGRHTPYAEILPPIEKKLGVALAAKGVRRSPAEIPAGDCCLVRIELLQALETMTPGGTISANLVLRLSIDGTDFSKVFQGNVSHRKLAGTQKGWEQAFDKRLDEASDNMIKAIVEDQQFVRSLRTGAP
jgi:hypothetical protein